MNLTRLGVVFVAAAVAITGLTSVTAANATNGGTVSGNLTDGCDVSWRASAVMDADLTNDDPEYPGLMVALDGSPVHYTNGGYIEEVTPAFGDPGLFEMNHFYVGSGAAFTQVWRVPTATDYTILDASVTFRLPAEIQDADVSVAFDAASTNSRIKDWGPTYAKYAWGQRAAAVDNGDGTWTVDLGDLPRGQGTVYQFNVALGNTNFTPNDRFVASAELSGTYAPGNNGGNCGVTDGPELPVATPDLPDCTTEFLGQTLWTVYDRDITVRTKIQGNTETDEIGEVNSDGWGAGADAWGEGNTRTFRLYAATKVALTDVTYVIDAVQGVKFNAVSVSAASINTPGGGQLQNNGYVEPVEGVTVTPSEDGSTIRVHIDRMPTMSSLSFNATGVLDGTRATMALNHRLIGTVEGCAKPEPVIEATEWVASNASCDTQTVTESRTVTTTGTKWDPDTLSWVPAEPVTKTETRERPMTDAEKEACDTEVVVTNPTTPQAPAETTLPKTGSDPAPWGGIAATAALLLTGAVLIARRWIFPR